MMLFSSRFRSQPHLYGVPMRHNGEAATESMMVLETDGHQPSTRACAQGTKACFKSIKVVIKGAQGDGLRCQAKEAKGA